MSASHGAADTHQSHPLVLTDATKPICACRDSLRTSTPCLKGKERKGKERKGKERKGKERKGKERKGKERKGKERKGKERKGKERKGKERKGKERKGKERKGKERKAYAFQRRFPEKPSIIPGCLRLWQYTLSSLPSHCSMPNHISMLSHCCKPIQMQLCLLVPQAIQPVLRSLRPSHRSSTQMCLCAGPVAGPEAKPMAVLALAAGSRAQHRPQGQHAV